MDSKNKLRFQMRHLRTNLDAKYRRDANQAIYSKLIHTPEVINARTIATFVSFDTEVDTHQLISHSLAGHRQVVVPKVTNGDLTFHEIHNLNELHSGYQGIPEPDETHPIINARQIDICIVPGLAFDVNGYRLGYGKGFYDRFLGKYSTIFSIGICFTNQLLYEIPHQETDYPVKQIVTDTITRFTFT